MEQKSKQLENESIDNQVIIKDEYENYLRSFPDGYRFVPTDQELIINYLQPKINETPLPPNMMHETNIYEHKPEDLTENYSAQGEKMWYFFTSREKKYPNGERPDRKASDGYWKATGADKPIKQEDGIVIGFRKALVFYRGKAQKGKKTSWIMHEFRLNAPSQVSTRNEYTRMRLDDCILCRIYKKERSSRNQLSGSRHPKTKLDVEVNDKIEVSDQDQMAIEDGATSSLHDMMVMPSPINVIVPANNNNNNTNMINYYGPSSVNNNVVYVNQDAPNYYTPNYDHGNCRSMNPNANMVQVSPNSEYNLSNGDNAMKDGRLLNRYYRSSEPSSSFYVSYNHNPMAMHNNVNMMANSVTYGNGHHNAPYYDHDHNPISNNVMATTSSNGHNNDVGDHHHEQHPSSFTIFDNFYR